MATQLTLALGEWMTLDGAAQVLGVTYWQDVGYSRRHKVPTRKLGGRLTLVKLADLNALKQPQE